jgi:Na+-transporting NADH:ubiquinone oxidoreductase subunit NqrC
LAKGKTSKKDVGENLARQTIYEIFNHRMNTRLRDIASGKAAADATAAAAEAEAKQAEAQLAENSQAENIIDTPETNEPASDTSGEAPQAAE